MMFPVIISLLCLMAAFNDAQMIPSDYPLTGIASRGADGYTVFMKSPNVTLEKVGSGLL